MIVLKIIAGFIIFCTVSIAILSQFFEVVDRSELAQQQEMQASNAQPIIDGAPVLDVRRRAGAVACKFEPVTDSPQQFAADYLFGDLMREGEQHVFSARVAVPSGGYTVSYGDMVLVGTQAILEVRLNKPLTQALEMIDTVAMQRRLIIPPEALTLRVVLRRPFAWGPDALVCAVVRPSSAVPAPAPVPAPVQPAPAPVSPVAPAQ